MYYGAAYGAHLLKNLDVPRGVEYRKLRGIPGLAWAARRSFLNQIGMLAYFLISSFQRFALHTIFATSFFRYTKNVVYAQVVFMTKWSLVVAVILSQWDLSVLDSSSRTTSRHRWKLMFSLGLILFPRKQQARWTSCKTSSLTGQLDCRYEPTLSR